eukprot:6201514-Pleurochrysis_carterae.AAC.7
MAAHVRITWLFSSSPKKTMRSCTDLAGLRGAYLAKPFSPYARARFLLIDCRSRRRAFHLGACAKFSIRRTRFVQMQ